MKNNITKGMDPTHLYPRVSIEYFRIKCEQCICDV